MNTIYRPIFILVSLSLLFAFYQGVNFVTNSSAGRESSSPFSKISINKNLKTDFKTEILKDKGRILTKHHYHFLLEGCEAKWQIVIDSEEKVRPLILILVSDTCSKQEELHYQNQQEYLRSINKRFDIKSISGVVPAEDNSLEDIRKMFKPYKLNVSSELVQKNGFTVYKVFPSNQDQQTN